MTDYDYALIFERAGLLIHQVRLELYFRLQINLVIKKELFASIYHTFFFLIFILKFLKKKLIEKKYFKLLSINSLYSKCEMNKEKK